MDLLARGSNWLERTRTRFATQWVTYRRGGAGGPVVQVRATIGKTTFPVENSAGVLFKLESRDYLISVADLVLGGVPVTPASGDQVIEGPVAAGSAVYEVAAPADGEGEWRYSDPYRRTYRIHAKFVNTSP